MTESPTPCRHRLTDFPALGPFPDEIEYDVARVAAIPTKPKTLEIDAMRPEETMIDRALMEQLQRDTEQSMFDNYPRIMVDPALYWRVVTEHLALRSIVESMMEDGIIGRSGNSDGFPWYHCRWCREHSTTYLEDLVHDDGCIVARALALVGAPNGPDGVGRMDDQADCLEATYGDAPISQVFVTFHADVDGGIEVFTTVDQACAHLCQSVGITHPVWESFGTADKGGYKLLDGKNGAHHLQNSGAFVVWRDTQVPVSPRDVAGREGE